MTQVSNDGIITTNSIVWDDKVLLAEPEKGTCFGCYFRKHGGCHRPTELKAYMCVGSLRSDFRSIIWVEKQDG